jgi:hypothetical protein
MTDCVLTSPNIVAMDNKVHQIQEKAEKRANENLKIYEQYEEVRNNYLKEINARFAEKADIAKDLISQIEEQ